MVCLHHRAELLPTLRKILFNQSIGHLNMALYLPGCRKPGYYGESCTLECPQNCQEGHCHITEGTCLGCLPGYIGPTCNTGKDYHFVKPCLFRPVSLFPFLFQKDCSYLRPFYRCIILSTRHSTL